MPSTARPVGVTVLVILQALLGVLALLGGLALFFTGLVLPEIFPYRRFFGPASIISGLALIILALIDFVLAFGLWSGKRWAWVTTLIFAVLSIASAVFMLFIRPRVSELVSLILDLVVLYYLMQPRVQGYFGRGVTKAPMSGAM